MNRVIYLALKEPKCPGSLCRNPKPCARHEVLYTPGRPSKDFSVGTYGMAECMGSSWVKHIALAAAVPPPTPAVVHETPDWLRCG